MPEPLRISTMSDQHHDAPPPLAVPARPKREKRKPRVNGDGLHRLFDGFAYQYGSDIAWDVQRKVAIRISHLRHTFGNDAVKIWMNSERRRVVFEDQVVFDPSCRCGPECVNLFGGLDMQPKEGDCQPILNLLLHLVNDDIEVYDWIICWLSYLFQNLGAKMPTAIIMHGDEGSGKNLFWEIVRDMFGEYALVVGQDQIESQFNDWISRKLLVICDEVLSRVEKYHLKGKMKAMISGGEIQINTKMMPLRKESNHANLVFLSNELQPAALDSSDRRYLVVWTPRKRPRAFYEEVVRCLAAGGREAFLHFLMTRNLTGFDPFSEPPRTRAKEELVALGRPSAERFWLDWFEQGLDLPRRACSSEQAYRAYRRWCAVTGERFPRVNSVFAREVARIAGDNLLIKPVRVMHGSVQKNVRMWLFTPPPEDVALGDWAASAINDFEHVLRDYINPFSHQE